MLTLGVALARKPRLMLVDELSLGLAPVIVERLMPVVSTFAKQSGCALLVVEQHIHIALAVADRGYVLSHGELVIHAPADELRAPTTSWSCPATSANAPCWLTTSPRYRPDRVTLIRVAPRGSIVAGGEDGFQGAVADLTRSLCGNRT